MRRTLFGAILGVAWGAGLRAWMAVIAGASSRFTWTGTFLGVLLPSALIGAAHGWAEHTRQDGGRRAWRWTALTPLLFVVMPLVALDDFVAQLMSGLGTGAIATALIGMLGGYALSGRGPVWARTTVRAFFAAVALAAIVGAVVNSSSAEGPRAPSASSTFLALTFLALLGLLAAACTIPHLPVCRKRGIESSPTTPHYNAERVAEGVANEDPVRHHAL